MAYVRVTDSRIMQLDPNDAHVAVKEGAQNVAYIPLTSASLSTSNCTFNLNNIATEVCRSRRQCMNLNQIVFTLNVTQTNAVAIFDSLGFHPWPLNRIISNISHQINQASYSLNLNQIIDSITKFNLESENSNFFDNTSYDAISNYANARLTAIDPIRPFTSSEPGWGVFKPRSNNIVLSANLGTGSPQNITVTCSLYEPLCSPFNNVGRKEDNSLYAINGEILQLQFVNDIFNNMIAASLHAGATLNSVSVQFPATCTLDCIYLTPNQDFSRHIPHNSISHYNNYSIFSIDTGAVNAGATTSVTSPVCQLTNLPFKILVYARQSDATRSAFVPDRYLQITNVQNCQLDNGSNQLSSASQNQLYELSNRNGCALDRDVWQQQVLNPFQVVNGAAPIYGCGSILALDPKIDLGCRADISDGSPGRYIFQITLALKNNTSDNFTGTTLYVIAVTNAILERSGSEYRNYLFSLPPNAIMEAKQMDPMAHAEFCEAQEANMFLSGGSVKSFFQKVWKFIKPAAKFAWKHKEAIAKYGLPIAKQALGLGEGEGNDMMMNEKKHGFHPQNMGKSFNVGRHAERRMDLFYQ